MLKLKTSQQTKNQAPKPETSKIVKKDDQKKASIDLDEEQEETNLVEVAKKPEKKQPAIQQTTTDGWQQSDDPKDLPTNGIGKKPNASLKKQDEPVIEIRNEEFPDLAVAADLPKQTKKQKNLQSQPKQDQKPQPTTNNAMLFTNSCSKPQTQATSNIQTKNTQLNSNSGPLTFTNTKKQENTALFQQQQQEQIKKTQQETQVQPQPQIQETQKSNPPQRQINITRNSNTVSTQPVPEQQKQLKVEESIPTFINSKVKGNPPIVQQQQQPQEQQQQQQQQQQPQEQQPQNEDEDSDGWETVEKKRKPKVAMQRNQKKNS
ncbi:unnamed protein product [Paramecium pentaurelia]|uniref:Uncharacterized protein n=1 Tax=Paramecium pentaurelia TaxID=43138 RepID=A0A8S1VHX9_9CILI|nr:unnamed protein product [Paramecium pentaurelia]